MKLEFPDTRPDSDESKVMVWTIQQILINEAETLLGARDQSKTICQPAFGNGPPSIFQTTNVDGAVASLSPAAAGYWPTLVYELAHETIHLLDPVVGFANWIEEGTAVRFSIRCVEKYTKHPMSPGEGSFYHYASKLLDHIPAPLFETIRLLRQRVGKLSLITEETILSEFPHVGECVAAQCQKLGPTSEEWNRDRDSYSWILKSSTR